MSKKTSTTKNSNKKRLFLHILKNLLIGFTVSIITLAIAFVVLEKYFTKLYSEAEATPQTALSLEIYKASSYRSWDHKPLAKAEHGYGYPTPTININSIGLRDEEIPEEKTKTRVLLLGDSFTFGMGVRKENNFASQLQSYLGTSKYLTINGGVIGQTVDDALMYLKNEGQKLKPDYVIYNFFVGNDVTEMRRHSWEKDEKGQITRVIDTELEVDETGKLRQKEVEKPKSFFLFWLKEKINILKQKYLPAAKGRTMAEPSLTWPVFLPEDHPDQDPRINEYWDMAEESLKEMNDFCKLKGYKFFVAVIPMDVQISKDYWSKYPNSPFNDEAFEMKRPQKMLEHLGQKHGFRVLDVLPMLKEEEKLHGYFYFDNDPHFNALGHKFFAAYLWWYMMEKIK